MDFTKIRTTLEAIDKEDGQTSKYLYWKYNILRKIAKVSFGFQDSQIPNVKFTSIKGKVCRRDDTISFDGMNQAYETLTGNDKLIEALAVKLIWRYLMKPGDFCYLKFDDIYQEDRQYFINIPSNQRRGSRKERLTKDLAELVDKIKKNKFKDKTYGCETRKGLDRASYCRAFYIFGKGKNYISDLFKDGFKGAIPDLNITALQLLNASKNSLSGIDRMSDESDSEIST